VGAAIALALKVTFSIEAPVFARATIAILASIVAGTAINRVNNWVTSLEVEQASKSEERTVIIRSVLSSPKHLYDLSGDAGKNFEEALKKQKEHREVIRVGCTAWSEESCVAAGKFLIVFSRAGWVIDSKQVFRMQPQIPVEGVALVSNDPKAEEGAKDLPPHLGVWHKVNASEQTFYWAFRGLGIPISSSIDSSLPDGTLGIYFGSEPQR
jgi:hypothetical protein